MPAAGNNSKNQSNTWSTHAFDRALARIDVPTKDKFYPDDNFKVT
jgi:hypothetical protein